MIKLQKHLAIKLRKYNSITWYFLCLAGYSNINLVFKDSLNVISFVESKTICILSNPRWIRKLKTKYHRLKLFIPVIRVLNKLNKI